MAPTLNPEVWLEVFRHLLQPLPLVQSETLQNRSLIRQPHLARCLRVSQEWYSLASLILYRTVVSDSLPLLLAGINTPPSESIPGILSKASLIGRIRHLYLEYQEKHDDYDLTYEDLMKCPDIFNILVGGKGERLERLDVEAFNEVATLHNGFDMLVIGDRDFFTRLKTLSCGAIFGQQETTWRRLVGSKPTYSADERYEWQNGRLSFESYVDIVFKAQERLLELVSDASSLLHFCQSGIAGPLGVGPTYLPRKRHLLSFACHNHDPDPNPLSLPAALGIPSSWYLHTPRQDRPDMTIGRWFYNNTLEVLKLRGWLAKSRVNLPSGTDLTILCAIFYLYNPSGVRMKDMTDKEKREGRVVLGEVRELLSMALEKWGSKVPKDLKHKDLFGVGALYDTPPCSACLWDPRL